MSRYRSPTLLLCVLLMVLHGLWYGWPNALFGMLPVALLLPGLLGGRRLAIAFAGFVALGYLAHGLTEFAVTPGMRWWSGTEMLLAVLMLAASSVWLKARAQQARN